MRLRLPIDLRSERGTTLIELLVAIPAAVAVTVAAMGLAGVFGRSQQVVDDHSHAVSSAQVALDRLTRDIREANAVSAPSPNSSGSTLQLSTQVGQADGSHIAETVSWTCAASTAQTAAHLATCTRMVAGATSPTASFVISTAQGDVANIFCNAQLTCNGAVDPPTGLDGSSLPAYVSVTAYLPTRSQSPGSSPTVAVTAGGATLNTPPTG